MYKQIKPLQPQKAITKKEVWLYGKKIIIYILPEMDKPRIIKRERLLHHRTFKIEN